MKNFKVRIPKEKTLEAVFKAIKESGGINRKSIMAKTRFDGNTIDLCLPILVTDNKIKKEFIRMSGPYKVHKYKAK